jgi:hypothetical protein
MFQYIKYGSKRPQEIRVKKNSVKNMRTKDKGSPPNFLLKVNFIIPYFLNISILGFEKCVRNFWG